MMSLMGPRQMGQRSLRRLSSSAHTSQQLAWRQGAKRAPRTSLMQMRQRRASSQAAAISGAISGIGSPSFRQRSPHLCVLKKLSMPCAPLSVPPFLCRRLPLAET